jgi:acyl-coenzyme A synthetase/AMP-(fatty) acid ligase
MDEQIKTKGERVSPKEIEIVLHALDGVTEAAVVGVPDEVLGQAIQCYIVCESGSGLTAKDVIRHCMVQLEPFMVPKYVKFITEMPKTSHHKVDRHVLRARCQQVEKNKGRSLGRDR